MAGISPAWPVFYR